MKLKTIPPESIAEDPSQPRLEIEGEELNSLAMSIVDLGQLQPVIVYSEAGKYCLVDGHRRVAAIRQIGRTDVNALVLDEKPDADTLLLTQLAANCLRVNLKPTEKALAFQRLKDSRGWTNVQLAKAMHISKSTVTQVLSYLSLPGEVKEKLDSGELPGSTAYAISRAKDDDFAEKLIAKAVNGDLKRDDAVRSVSGKAAKVRSTFRMETCVVSIVTGERLELPEVVAVLQQLARECSKAAKNDHDVVTLERALAKRHQASK